MSKHARDRGNAASLPRLCSVVQAAHELGVGRSLVYEMLATEMLRSVKVKRRRLIPREAIDEFVANLSK